MCGAFWPLSSLSWLKAEVCEPELVHFEWNEGLGMASQHGRALDVLEIHTYSSEMERNGSILGVLCCMKAL